MTVIGPEHVIEEQASHIPHLNGVRRLVAWIMTGVSRQRRATLLNDDEMLRHFQKKRDSYRAASEKLGCPR